MTTITGKEELESIDVDSLTLDPKFGSLTFNDASKKLNKIKKWLIELDKLGYSNLLPETVVAEIQNCATEFDGYIDWLRNFAIDTSPNPKQEHDHFENQINTFFNQFYIRFVVTHLTYLKQEAQTQSKDKKNLAEEQKKLAEIRRNYEDIVKGVQNETKQLEKARTEQAAKRFGKHFELQSKKNKTDADFWLEKRNLWFITLIGTILVNLVFYLYLFTTYKLNLPPNLKPSDFFTIEYGLVKLTLISVLSYAISFTSRNFNINSNLVTLEQHRKNVAETLNDFIDSDLEKEDRSKIVEKATEAMFTHRPIGYLPKIETKDEGPISSIYNFINPFNRN